MLLPCVVFSMFPPENVHAGWVFFLVTVYTPGGFHCVLVSECGDLFVGALRYAKYDMDFREA